MKILKKVLAIILSLIIVCSAGASVSAISFKNVSDYKQTLEDEGYPVFTTDDFYKIYNFTNTVYRVFSGTWIFPKETFNLTVDPFITDVCNRVADESGLDLIRIVTSLPETNQISELITTTLRIDTVEFRNLMYSIRDKCDELGLNYVAYLYYFAGVYMSVIELCEIYSVPNPEDPTLHEVYIRLVFKDGGEQVMNPKIVIDSETGKVFNYDNKGIVGLGYNFNLTDLVVYTTVDCWMRDYGFCFFYDLVAYIEPIFFKYQTRRFKFDYNGMEYMIQAWKGNYLISNGGEVGIYCRDESKFGSYYDCANDEQMLNMSMQILHNDDVLVDEGPMLHWWINGFNLSNRMYLPKSLTMKFSIEMTDEEMLEAFCEAVDNHYMNDVTYTVDGLTVYVVW